jgi:hypothetical protein
MEKVKPIEEKVEWIRRIVHISHIVHTSLASDPLPSNCLCTYYETMK